LTLLDNDVIIKNNRGTNSSGLKNQSASGTPIRIGVIAAKGDVKLHNQLEKAVAFYTFCIP